VVTLYEMCFLSSKKVVVSGHACLLGEVLFPKGLTCCEGNKNTTVALAIDLVP